MTVVLGVIQNTTGKFLVIERQDATSGIIWGFPGGKVEAGELPENAVLREIKEETGLHCELVTLLGERAHPTTKSTIIYYLCNSLEDQFSINPIEVKTALWLNGRETIARLGQDIFQPVKDYLKKIA